MSQPLQLEATGGIATTLKEIILCEHILTDPAQFLSWYCVIETPVLPEAQHRITELIVVVGPGQKRPLHSPFCRW